MWVGWARRTFRPRRVPHKRQAAHRPQQDALHLPANLARRQAVAELVDEDGQQQHRAQQHEPEKHVLRPAGERGMGFGRGEGGGSRNDVREVRGTRTARMGHCPPLIYTASSS